MMTIEKDVADVAKHWGLDPALLQAVVVAEENIIKAVQCSFPEITTRAQALDILARSATHALCDFVRANGKTQADFVLFWAAKWAPIGAKNDPTLLNANWPRNVLTNWRAFHGLPAAVSGPASPPAQV